jgi:exonuclease SbcC
MEDNYISNLDENNDVELEIYEKYESLKIDFEKLSNEMNDLKKENLEQKHHIQDLEIDNAHKTETVKNQEGLIKFYKQYRSEHEESSLEKKFAQLEEQIKSLKESVEIKNKKLEDLNKELQDQIILNEKLVNVITNKEEIIKKLEKGVNPEEEGDGEKSNIAKLEEEIDQLKERISDLGSEKDKIIDKYEDKMSKINKENNDYQDKIYNYETEILNLKESIKKYEIDEAKTKGGEEAEKEVEKLYKEEIESLKNALNDSKESKKQLKENAQKQRDSDVKEIMDLEQTVDELRKELAEAKRNTSIMELQKKILKK